ncbi:LLM class flavin-dependent oxidoreductase [Streptomyces gelaticus]|uniref:LLM class flavin-dependent oxidoreductase n=1 Tax=Streptomyces gelaticus TaxID=285446 RepID=UPI0037BD8750
MDDRTPQEFKRHLCEVSAWAEAAGLRGLLVFSDNDSLDPWAISQFIIERTETIVPMVAVNPMYMHPFNVARLISTIGQMYARQVDLNFVSGGFKRHLLQVGSLIDHDERYARLAEYGEIVARLLLEPDPVTFNGKYYQVKSASISPRLPPELMPRFFVSGSSEACVRVRRELDAVRLSYPREVIESDEDAPLKDLGVGLGIIAREDAADAWDIAHRRFPRDEMGEKMHQWASRIVESRWHIDLAYDAEQGEARNETYWLYPFRSGRTFSPYLVGSYGDVGNQVSRYVGRGVSAIILDEISEPDDLQHTMAALSCAEKGNAEW